MTPAAGGLVVRSPIPVTQDPGLRGRELVEKAGTRKSDKIS